MAGTGVEALLKRIEAGNTVPAILLLGSDSYLRDLCRAKLIETYVEDGTREWAVGRFSAKADSPDVVLGQAQMLPMLAPRQVIFWSDVNALEKGDEETRKSNVKKIAAYLDDPAPFTVLVMEAEGLDKRTGLFKTVSEKTIVVDCEPSEDMSVRLGLAVTMAAEMARELKVELDSDAAQALAENANAGLARIRTELEKLATFTGDRKRITREDVEALVISDQKYSVWELSGMLASGDRQRAMLFLESLFREGEQAVGMVGAMAWMFRKLIEVQDLPRGSGVWEAARLGMRKETAELAVRYAPRISREQLVSGVQYLSEADSQLKSGIAAPRAVLEFLIARLTARRGDRAAVGSASRSAFASR
jgi:DNA polymerase III subunit delta